MRVIEVNMEQHHNEGAGEMGDPREGLPTNGIVRHDSHYRKSGERANRSATTALNVIQRNYKKTYRPTISVTIPNQFIQTVAKRLQKTSRPSRSCRYVSRDYRNMTTRHRHRTHASVPTADEVVPSDRHRTDGIITHIVDADHVRGSSRNFTQLILPLHELALWIDIAKHNASVYATMLSYEDYKRKNSKTVTRSKSLAANTAIEFWAEVFLATTRGISTTGNKDRKARIEPQRKQETRVHDGTSWYCISPSHPVAGKVLEGSRLQRGEGGKCREGFFHSGGRPAGDDDEPLDTRAAAASSVGVSPPPVLSFSSATSPAGERERKRERERWRCSPFQFPPPQQQQRQKKRRLANSLLERGGRLLTSFSLPIVSGGGNPRPARAGASQKRTKNFSGHDEGSGARVSLVRRVEPRAPAGIPASRQLKKCFFRAALRSARTSRKPVGHCCHTWPADGADMFGVHLARQKQAACGPDVANCKRHNVGRKRLRQASCVFHLGQRHMGKRHLPPPCIALTSASQNTTYGLIPWLMEGNPADRGLAVRAPIAATCRPDYSSRVTACSGRAVVCPGDDAHACCRDDVERKFIADRRFVWTGARARERGEIDARKAIGMKSIDRWSERPPSRIKHGQAGPRDGRGFAWRRKVCEEVSGWWGGRGGRQYSGQTWGVENVDGEPGRCPPVRRQREPSPVARVILTWPPPPSNPLYPTAGRKHTLGAVPCFVARLFGIEAVLCNRVPRSPATQYCVADKRHVVRVCGMPKSKARGTNLRRLVSQRSASGHPFSDKSC
ncbi:hypothetical protein PR048_021202 [Dryococelus australis]|uniref:Uncharacterized protein n=1 Tax=Dryococelus australis TaxID=614101 RepID=A0ABQ9GXK8_9NEOP|nr:hypothetical protein PR048_021202 [Dryococelus australis]